MKEDRLESLFKDLQGSFDLQEPSPGHRERFMEKLETRGVQPLRPAGKSRQWWKHLSIAASVVLIALIGIRLAQPEPTRDEQVARISPEISKTEFYFASLIEEQVRELEKESSPETQKLVDDTLFQLRKLETDYAKLEQDLLTGGNSQIILSAMIKNFQTRIDLLHEVLNKIETIKNFKTDNDENYTI